MSTLISFVDSVDNWTFDKWTWRFTPMFCSILLIGFEALSTAIPAIFSKSGIDTIAIKGKHLDKFSTTDKSFILINKLVTTLFVYHLLYTCYYTPTIYWQFSEITIFNTLVSFILFFLFYDFMYMNFHRLLHVRSLYAFIHKHHHRQKAPTRGNLDAINVHPFEFIVGEYLHLLTVYCIPCHIITVFVFILTGGILASLNHTRFDVNIPMVYEVKNHDVHHRIPESNYSQYTPIWDKLFGTYRSYLGKDGEIRSN